MSLKVKLVLSHSLPILVLVPFLGFYLLSAVRGFYYERLNDDLFRASTIVAQSLQAAPELAGDPARLQKLLGGVGPQITGRIEIVGRDGTILASSRGAGDAQAGTLSADPGVTSALRGQASTEIGQGDVAAVAVPANAGLAGAVRSSLSLADVEGMFHRLDLLIAAGALALALLSLAIGYWFSQTIAAPLQQLSRDAKAVAQGDYSRHIRMNDDAEVAELAANFNEMVDQLAEQRAARERLLHDIAHELRRPIGALQAAIEVVRDASAPCSDPVEYLINGLTWEMGRLGRLTHRLTFAAQDGHATLLTRRAPVDMISLVNRAVVLFKPEAQRLGVELISELPGALPLVQADEDALFEILTNLVDNALKFTPAGGQVRISAGSVNDRAWVQVADTGMGLTAEEQANLFKRYYRGDQARARPRGIGLGLAIAHELAQAHDGTIRVCSQPDHGATFRVEIPR